MSMRRNAGAAATLVIAAGCAVGLTAQSGAGNGREQSGSTITVTGCLQNRSSGTSPATSTRSGAYILANATTGQSNTQSSTGTTATGTAAATDGYSDAAGLARSGSGSPSEMVGGYVLDGSDSDLKKHLGHRIEVTGTVNSTGAVREGDPTKDPYGSTAATTTATGSGQSTAASGNKTGEQRIRVTSVRMISPDCAGSGR